MERLLLFSIILSFSHCSSNVQTDLVEPIESDTTVLLRESLRKAISVEFMPDADALTSSEIFNDTIFLTSSAVPLNMLPISIDNWNFKILEEQEIIKVFGLNTGDREAPNYLKLKVFERNDYGYYIHVQNLSAVAYGGGGSLGLYYQRKGDSLINVKRLSTSIN
jgi:hypothetical protein